MIANFVFGVASVAEGGEPAEELERGEPDHGAAVGRGPWQVIDDLALGPDAVFGLQSRRSLITATVTKTKPI